MTAAKKISKLTMGETATIEAAGARDRVSVHWGGARESYIDVGVYIKGKRYAPCGQIIGSTDFKDTELRSSTDEVPRVTCPSCRRALATAGRAYAKARRLHLIEW